MNEELLRKLRFNRQADAVKQGKCPTCGETIDLDDFKDDLSRREFRISGMCQKCQDKTFS